MSGHPCPERLLLPEALSGRLDPTEEKRVMAHLQTCATCQDVAAELEVSLISLAVLRDEEAVPLRTAWPPAAVAGAAPLDGSPADSTPTGATPVHAGGRARRRRLPAYLSVAAAAALFAAGGVFVGHSFLPPRDQPDFGPAVALSPPDGTADSGARGTVAVATQGDGLAVRLDATSLPKAGWYECVWVAGGQSRSAGSFRATNGVVKDIRLRVAQPQDSSGWDLQLVHHQGSTSEVVLEGDVAYG